MSVLTKNIYQNEIYTVNELTIIKEYRKGESITSLAKKYNTYPNMIRRILIKHKEPIRSQSEAQKLALKTGRAKHPTEGKERSREEKLSIGIGVSKQYKELSDEEKDRRSGLIKEYWDELDPKDRQKNIDTMNKGRIKSAFKGSKLERNLVNTLSQEGIVVNFHTKVFGDVEVDIFLPEYALAIEIDGPTHYNPIWGEEALKKTKEADRRKNGYLINNDITVLRVKNFKNSYATIQVVSLANFVKELLCTKRTAKVIKVDLDDLEIK